jgi:4-hydroxy-3-polyprenylbenzoate decarboxylase
MKTYVLAMAGASGQVYGVRVLGELLKSAHVHLVISSTALSILKGETGIDWTSGSETETQQKVRDYFSTDRVSYWSEHNMSAPVASGSFRTDGMLVVPCSMKTLAGIRGGYANTLIERAADVTLKEGRPLLLSPREMPLNAIHLENMLVLARLGVKIAPPMPAFYHQPESLDQMVDFVAGKILDAMGIEHSLFRRWGEGTPPSGKGTPPCDTGL